jgi:hypothetical protein
MSDKKEQWIWSVSVRYADWEETICDNEADAHQKLQEYFDDSENDGDTVIDPTFTKMLVTDFKKVCPWHGCELTRKNKKLHCQDCKDDGGDPYPEYHSFTYNKVKS